jgi:hypothetical protein
MSRQELAGLCGVDNPLREFRGTYYFCFGVDVSLFCLPVDGVVAVSYAVIG